MLKTLTVHIRTLITILFWLKVLTAFNLMLCLIDIRYKRNLTAIRKQFDRGRRARPGRRFDRGGPAGHGGGHARRPRWWSRPPNTAVVTPAGHGCGHTRRPPSPNAIA